MNLADSLHPPNPTHPPGVTFLRQNPIQAVEITLNLIKHVFDDE